jgi:prepilin-type N-terminal cleavage/methylation domain-containing protein
MKLQVAGSRLQVPSGELARAYTCNLQPENLLPSPRSAFTLVEIMIVVAILGIVLGMGIPSMFRAMKREGMRAAMNDVLEACQKARAAAILSGSLVELQILPQTGEFKVVAGSTAPPSANVLDALPAELARTAPAPPAPTIPSFSIQLPSDVSIELLDVNFVELKDAEDVRVKFRPNGTSDEMTVVLRSRREEWRKISLEVTTALAEMEAIR